MNKTLISRLVIGAVAALAAGGVMAGQIQASSVSIAREAITTDAQAITAPAVAYRFAGDVDARSQAQTFQVQFTLSAGEWAVAPTADAISVTDGVSGKIQAQRAADDTTVATAGQVAVGIVATYQVLSVQIDTANPKTLWATIVVNQDAAGALIKQPLISVNVPSNVVGAAVAPAPIVGTRGTVKGLYTVVGDLLADHAGASKKCVDNKVLPVSFKHYVALNNPMAVASDANATPDEHTRAGATNTATLMTFPTNLLVNVALPDGTVKLTPGGSMKFVANVAASDALVADAYISPTKALLGTVAMSQNASGYDSNLANQYLLTGNPAGLGVTDVATAGLVDGNVEAKDLKVVVSATNGFVTGGKVSLQTSPVCAGGGAILASHTVLAADTNGPFTLTTAAGSVLNAALGVAGTTPVYVCYDVPGTVTIPSSKFSAVATLEKADAGAGFDEQDNICHGDYISLGGGLKIDVRNYASSAETSGYQSVIRFINNSDTAKADVWAQIIHQDGKLGGFAKLMDLEPRAVVNMTAAQIDALLVNAPTAAIGATAPAASATGAPRLRITSNSGMTLRVQNYLFNNATGQILEGSNAQGVDFEGSADRAPGNEGQYQIQDANSGLNLQ